mgnify:FL=1
MPLFINHRINNLVDLKKIKIDEGIEADVRDFKNDIILSHDPYKNSEKFNKFIKYFDNKFIILNIKSYGIIKDILKLIKRKKNFFFLDLHFSEIDYLIKKNLDEKIILRFSIYEKFDLRKKYFRKIKWIWYDFFKNKYLTKKEIIYFKKHKKKICIVSPELLNKGKKNIIKYIDYLNKNDIKVDAVCCKNKSIILWKKLYKFK